jgi:putative transposase
MVIAKNSRSSYHTDVKLAFQLGILPVNLVTRIPRSSRHRFKSTDYSTLVGTEFSAFMEKLDLAKSIMSSRSTLAVASAFLRIISLLRILNLPPSALPKIKNMEVRSKIVKRIIAASRYIPLGKILTILKLSPRRFVSWKKNKLPCPSSPLGLCRVSVPSQLAKGEVLAIRKAFSNPKTVQWPSMSVAWKLISNGIVSANVSTILTYARSMGLTSARKILHRSRKKGSIITTRPNEAWHIDVTVLRTQDGVRSYIQLIIDSFSKRILAFAVTLCISGKTTAALLRSALEALPRAPEASIMLISDGGSENVNASVKEYLSSVPLKLHVAHVDVSFSNSMIEAVNKILKYRYIFRQNIQSYRAVESVVKESITDYNARPHYALQGLSPDEVYAGKIFDLAGYKERLNLARERRLSENKRTMHPCTPYMNEKITEK